MTHRAAVAALFVAACSQPAPAAPPPSPAPTSVVPAASTPPVAAPAPAVEPTKAQPAPIAPPQLADESTAPGIVPLSAEEERESKRQCTSSLGKLQRDVQSTNGRLARTEKLLQLLKTSADIDERCRELLTRSTEAYLAATHESAATIQLKTMLVGLSAHFERTRELCASARPDDPAWACVKAPVPPQSRFRYGLHVDGQHYTLTATGNAIPSAGLTELFIEGNVEDGKVDLGAPVMRRTPRE